MTALDLEETRMATSDPALPLLTAAAPQLVAGLLAAGGAAWKIQRDHRDDRLHHTAELADAREEVRLIQEWVSAYRMVAQDPAVEAAAVRAKEDLDRAYQRMLDIRSERRRAIEVRQPAYSPHWVLVAFAFFWLPPMAIVAWVYASRARREANAGDWDRARRSSRLARVWSWATIAVGVPITLAGIFL
jgi:hypothetical protein